MPRAAVQRIDAASWEMGGIARPIISGAPREAEQQCLIRDANEAIELLNVALVAGAARLALRCECGDAVCLARVSLTHAEYGAVRAYGSHFAVDVNHENPESACVLSEEAHFAVIDVVAGDDRYQVLACNPRHAWVARVTGDDPAGRPSPEQETSIRCR